jgi:hypothetical protein
VRGHESRSPHHDHNVRVHATPVDHHQAFPFDTQDGSVVFSGGTGPDTKNNLQTLMCRNRCQSAPVRIFSRPGTVASNTSPSSNNMHSFDTGSAGSERAILV